MNRVVGVFVLVLILYATVVFSDEKARSLENQQNLAQRTGFYGVLTLGAGILIISGGIDLSMGSVLGLAAVLFGLLLENKSRNPWVAVGIVLAGAPIVGLINGLLVTKLKLQPFIVTLCGLFVYRGLARWATWTKDGSSRSVGIGGRPDLDFLREFAAGNLWGIPIIFLLLLGLALILGVVLHLSVAGRYLYAVGYNEQAARYAGIASDRYKILAYVICSTCAGLAGILHLLDVETAQPSSSGQSYELYAIAGAVLGGCSLRGGEGTIVGMILGAAVLPLLRNLCQFRGIPSDIEPTFIGVALLLGTIADEVLRRFRSRRAGGG